MIILLGKPGSGKGTQAELLVKQDHYLAISAGELLREEAKRNPDIAAIQKAGKLVSAEITGQLIERAIEGASGKRVILDGFPRTRAQAQWLKMFLREHPKFSIQVIILEISDNEVMERLAKRGRADDVASTIKTRLKNYHAEADHIAHLVAGIGTVHTLDGHGPIESVHKEILRVISKEEGM